MSEAYKALKKVLEDIDHETPNMPSRVAKRVKDSLNEGRIHLELLESESDNDPYGLGVMFDDDAGWH